MSFMKRNALILGAGSALLTASVAAHAQESGHLSADYLKQATPLIHWPQGLEPRNVDVFVHNEGWIDAPPEIVWANLIDATKWPSWKADSPSSPRVSASTGRRSVFQSEAPLMSSSRTGKSAGVSIVRSLRFTTPGCSCLSAAARALSLRKRKRVLTRSSFGSNSRTRCMMAMTGGCLR